MSKHDLDNPSFYLTVAAPCPYLEGREERKVFTHLVGTSASKLNDVLTQGGFRRSQSIAYRPACEGCKACISVRVIASEFSASRSQKRVLNKNNDLVMEVKDAEATKEQYSLFRRYLDARHADGGMADMMMLDFAMMVEDTHVNTQIVEYRKPQRDPRDLGNLVAVCLVDEMADGLSMVYSFFDPDYEARSLGTFMVLEQIRRTRQIQKRNLYLGYWVAEAPNMQYKSRFQPMEMLGGRGWELL